MAGRTDLKLGDFGAAKRTLYGEWNLPYVCSRFYRAPELILGATTYTTSVDIWSAGCVFSEMLVGQPLFTGKSAINQLAEIIKVCGTPTPQELRGMNPNYPEYEFTPKVIAYPWDKVSDGQTPRDVNDLVGKLLKYEPAAQEPPLHALMHRFFNVLRIETPSPPHKFPSRLFDFRRDELWWCTAEECNKLIPKHMRLQASVLTKTTKHINHTCMLFTGSLDTADIFPWVWGRIEGQQPIDSPTNFSFGCWVLGTPRIIF